MGVSLSRRYPGPQEHAPELAFMDGNYIGRAVPEFTERTLRGLRTTSVFNHRSVSTGLWFESELGSCVEVEVAVLGSPSLIVLNMGSVGFLNERGLNTRLAVRVHV